MKLITINNNNDKPLRASIEEINSVCSKCRNFKSYCDEDLNIKKGYMRCTKLSYKIEELKGSL